MRWGLLTSLPASRAGETMMKIAYALTVALVAGGTPASADPWHTRDGAVLCPNPFVIRDAVLAGQSKNDGWFKETACSTAPGGVPVLIVNRQAAIWYGRVYSPAGEFSAYFPYYAVEDAAPAIPADFGSILKGLTQQQLR